MKVMHTILFLTFSFQHLRFMVCVGLSTYLIAASFLQAQIQPQIRIILWWRESLGTNISIIGLEIESHAETGSN